MRTRMTQALAGALAAGALLLPTLPAQAATGSAAVRHDPGPGTAQGPRGKLLSAERIDTAAALPSAASTYRISYTSIGARGQRIVVTGTVAVPPGPAPRGGWPVLSWAHGTTGVADACAPSLDTTTGLAHSYVGFSTAFLDNWIREGYAVVQTDYEGLGTPGEHPYLNGVSAANTVSDIVIAARHLNKAIGKRWIVAGHSQGGHATLFTALQGDRHRGTELLGAISYAPGGVNVSQTVPYVANNLPGAAAALPFVPPLVIGAEAAAPSVDADALVTDVFQPVIDAARQVCLGQLGAYTAGISPADVFSPGADIAALTAYLATQEPERLPGLNQPTLILASTHDQLVAKAGVDLLVSRLCPNSPELSYRVYTGVDHRGVMTAGLADGLAYAAQLFAGAVPVGNCPAA